MFAEGKAGWTVRRIYSNFSASLSAAVDYGLIGVPRSASQAAAEGNRRRALLTHAEVERILGRLDEP
jgi:hypothetical protein